MGLIKKPKTKIGSTRAHELSAHMNRERASLDRDPYSVAVAPATFKMKRFADVKSKIVMPRNKAIMMSSSMAQPKTKTNTTLHEMNAMADHLKIARD